MNPYPFVWNINQTIDYAFNIYFYIGYIDLYTKSSLCRYIVFILNKLVYIIDILSDILIPVSTFTVLTSMMNEWDIRQFSNKN